MADNPTAVLYDHPGPKAKRLNLILTVAFAVLLLLGLWWVLSVLNEQGPAGLGQVETVPPRARPGRRTCCPVC